MNFFVRDIIFAISGVLSGIYIFYAFFKYKRMDYDELMKLPLVHKDRIIRARIEKYGWLLILSGAVCLAAGLYNFSLAFS